MKKIAFFGFLSSILILSAFVAGKETAYKVDVANSKVFWKGKKVTGEHYGYISLSDGALTVENGKLKGGNFEIDTKTITVTDIADASSNEKLVGHLKNDHFFDVEKHPKATFAITSATSKGGENYDIKGKLTIKGITNDVSFPATVKVEKSKVTAKALITIDRTKYDIKYGSKNFFENLGDKTIYNDFDLEVTLVAGTDAELAKKSK